VAIVEGSSKGAVVGTVDSCKESSAFNYPGREVNMAGLIEYWKSFDSNSSPYITREDKEVIEPQRHYTCTSYEEFLSVVHGEGGSEFFTKHKLHLGLIPQPFIGDLRQAKVFILMLNPGFGPIEYVQENQHQEFRDALRKNLRQSSESLECPFLFFDPRFLWTPGGEYWKRKLKDIIEAFCKRKNVSYLDATRVLSKKIATLELIPYHSASAPKDLVNLYSATLMKEFVRDILVPRAVAKEVVIVCTRQTDAWGLNGSSCNNVIVYKPKERQAASLGRGSRAWPRVAWILGLED